MCFLVENNGIKWSTKRTQSPIIHEFGFEGGKTGYQQRSFDAAKLPVDYFVEFVTDERYY